MTISLQQRIAVRPAPSQLSFLSDDVADAQRGGSTAAGSPFQCSLDEQLMAPAAVDDGPNQSTADGLPLLPVHLAKPVGRATLKLIHGKCLEVMRTLGESETIFADPPDNLGLKYGSYHDRLPDHVYLDLLNSWFTECVRHSPIVWFSFNAKWTAQFGSYVTDFLSRNSDWTYRPCVQVFTFGQHSQTCLGNNHRPLWCIHRQDASFFPDAIRVASWRQRNGDKRADPRGRVPGDVFDMQYPIDPAPGDVFDFPRVTGNSKQRCDWHPTQLHEDLIERVVQFSCKTGGTVLDPFAGTGTTLRVCARINRNCTSIEIDDEYCRHIAADLSLKQESPTCWTS